MKKFRQLFQDAERLTPPPGLWGQIEAQLRMRNGMDDKGMDDGKRNATGSGAVARDPAAWGSPAFRLAASVVLAVGVLGLGIFLKQSPTPVKHTAVSSELAVLAQAGTAEEVELVDPELLVWHADLGEINEEAEEAEEVL